ncbi:MAG: HAD-IC family P-type ATPase, partial [Erysipelotrichia bacterium]|nr:HAD-IC family P-type ATPase [Erysipelotrichia bacterium]
MAKKISKKSILEKQKIANERLIAFSEEDIEVLQAEYGFTQNGLTEERAEENGDIYGENKISRDKKPSVFKRLYEAFINPFTAILIVLAFVSLVTDVIIPEQKDWVTVIIITVMVLFSGCLRFVQETRSNNAAERLSDMVENTSLVKRDGIEAEIPLDEIVVGDTVRFAAGDIIPADIRIIRAKDLFIGQSSLTGEFEPVEKYAHIEKGKKYDSFTSRENLVFMGTTVISGSAEGVVAVTGDNTIFGQAAKSLTGKPERTSFEKGINSVSWLLIRIMLIMVPVVFFINGFTKGDWVQAFVFGVSIAVGLTPEMLPMIVTTCLAKGAMMMSRKKTIIKNLNSIQNFGAMDVLCADKTGTLTLDKVVLVRHMDVNGNEDIRVLRHAYLNSYFQTGLKNLMDLSIIERTEEFAKDHSSLMGLNKKYIKVDEIPFDFSRRRMSVVVEDKDAKRQMITKGAVEEILSICTYVEINGKVEELSENLKNKVVRTVDKLNA